MKLESSETLQLVIEALKDMKAKDIRTLDVTRMTAIADHMVVVTGTSTTHVNSIARNLIDEMKKKGIIRVNNDNSKDGQWALIDLGDIVVHVMLQDVRDFYSLEKLWNKFAETKIT